MNQSRTRSRPLPSSEPTLRQPSPTAAGHPPAPTAARIAPGELADWVRSRFRAGWRRLTVTDWSTGERIASIARDPATGRRTHTASPTWPAPPEPGRKTDYHLGA